MYLHVIHGKPRIQLVYSVTSGEHCTNENKKLPRPSQLLKLFGQFLDTGIKVLCFGSLNWTMKRSYKYIKIILICLNLSCIFVFNFLYLRNKCIRKFQKLTYYIVLSLILGYEQHTIFFYKMSYYKMMMCVKYSYNIYMY